MREAYIVDACRTPVGKRGGSLSTVHSADLGAHVIKALMARTGVDPAAVEDVIFGCCGSGSLAASEYGRNLYYPFLTPPLATLGKLASAADHPEEAAVHFDVAETLCRRLGHHVPLGWTLLDYGDSLLRDRAGAAEDAAIQKHDEAMQIATDHGISALVTELLKRKSILKA